MKTGMEQRADVNSKVSAIKKAESEAADVALLAATGMTSYK